MQLGDLYASELAAADGRGRRYNRALDLNPRTSNRWTRSSASIAAKGEWEDCIAGDGAPRRGARGVRSSRSPCCSASRACGPSRSGTRTRARARYERILQLEPTHVHAFEKLEELHREACGGKTSSRCTSTASRRTEEARDRVALLLRKSRRSMEKELDDARRRSTRSRSRGPRTTSTARRRQRARARRGAHEKLERAAHDGERRAAGGRGSRD